MRRGAPTKGELVRVHADETRYMDPERVAEFKRQARAEGHSARVFDRTLRVDGLDVYYRIVVVRRRLEP